LQDVTYGSGAFTGFERTFFLAYSVETADSVRAGGGLSLISPFSLLRILTGKVGARDPVFTGSPQSGTPLTEA
jgi:hypothetical protein